MDGASDLTSLASPRVSTLRGADVQVDAPLLGRGLIVLCLVGLLVVAAVLFVAGAHKNSQITALRSRGVPVTITIDSCLGQLGGSGTNAAGYSCTGTFVLEGRRSSEPIPGSTLYAPGTRLQGVSVPGDPALVSTVAIVRSEHTSWRVYLLPSGLLALLVALIVVGLLVHRRGRRETVRPD